MKRPTPSARCFFRNITPRLLGLLAGIMLFAASSVSAAGSGASFPGLLTSQNGTFTARITAAPLQQVMAELGKLSGAQVRWLNAGGAESVSVEFRDLSVEEALRRLLPQQNFLLLYSGGKLFQIWITSPGQSGGQPVLISRPVMAAPPIEDAKESEQESETEETRPEEQAQDVAQQLDTALETVQTSQEAARRVETIEMLQGRVKEDPRILATLTQLAAGDDDPSVRAAAAAVLEQQQ